jgi:molybdenum cofactor biosynthesis enzyme
MVRGNSKAYSDIATIMAVKKLHTVLQKCPT